MKPKLRRELNQAERKIKKTLYDMSLCCTLEFSDTWANKSHCFAYAIKFSVSRPKECYFLTQIRTKSSFYKDIPLVSREQFSSAQSCPALCDPMNRSTPGVPVNHQVPEFTQTHVHRVSDTIQPSHPLSYPSPPAPNPSQNQGLFQWVNSAWGGQSTVW